METELEIRAPLNKPQIDFMEMRKRKKFCAFVGGYASGKTWVGCVAICAHIWEHPCVNIGYFAPTYPLIRDVFFDKIDTVATAMGLSVVIKQANKEVYFYAGGQFRGKCICRSMDSPEGIAGFQIGHALIDELDILPTNKAKMAWNKIIARMRHNADGLRNGVDVTTTPEGFRFTWKRFVDECTESYGIVHASTYENEKNLPPGYIASLIETYPAALREAYLNGRFVNLTTGTVYNSYDRAAHNSAETITAGEPLFIGQDFNVGKMCSCVFVKRANGFHAVDQLKDIYDTPALVRTLKERYNGHAINIYPDASGANRHTNASDTDIALLKQAGYAVRVNTRNPAVRDRVLSVNVSFEKGQLYINSRKCPTVADCLERQSYDDNGEPNKKDGFDHMNDALGYMVVYENQVNKPIFTTNIRMGG